MMRIAYVCADPGVPVFGQKGCSVHVQEVIRAFRKHGAKVELFASRLGGEAPLDLSDIPVNLLPAAPKGDICEREIASYEANGELLERMKKAGSFDLVYERYSLWSFAAMEYARATNTRAILEVNAPLIEEQICHRGLTNRGLAEEIAKRVFNAATAVISVSAEVAEYVRRYVEKDRVHIIENGVDPERFPQGKLPSLRKDPGGFTIGFVGTLKPWHGLEHLIDAFAELHKNDDLTRLLIVGDGPERAKIEDELKSRGLRKAVHFTGAVEPDDIPGWLASMDVAVAPYPGNGNFYFSPLKVYEYMAARLPVVASRIGQLEDVIEDGTNGLLVPAGDANALAGALSRLRCDAQLRLRLGESARASVVKRHTWDSVVERIFSIVGVYGARQVSGREYERSAEVTG